MSIKSSTLTATGLAIVGVVIVAVVGSVLLEITDHDASRLYTFLLAIIPILIVQLYQGNQRAKDSEEIKSAVNGKLTAQLQAIKNDVNSHVSNEIERIKSDGNAES